MLWNHTEVEDPFRVQIEKWIFNLEEYEKLIAIVSDSTLQLTFEKLPLVEFWYSTKKNMDGYLKKLLDTPLFINYIYLNEARLSLHGSTKIAYHNRLNAVRDENPALFYEARY